MENSSQYPFQDGQDQGLVVTFAPNPALAALLSGALVLSVLIIIALLATLIRVSQARTAEWTTLEGTVAVLVLSTLNGSTTALLDASSAYALVLEWAFWGILSRLLTADEWNNEYPGVILVAHFQLPRLGVVTVVALLRWLRQPVTAWATVRLGPLGTVCCWPLYPGAT